MRASTVLAMTAATLVASPALAHSGHDRGGFLAGLLHPVGGLDHLAAMVAVGLWAGVVGGRRRWLWPAAFVTAMIAGAAAGWANLPPLGVETAIAASVAVLGLAIAAGWAPATALGAVPIAAFGFAHGFAHGVEMPGETPPWAYACGFVVGTALLHALGLGLAAALATLGSRVAPRLAGGALASLGALLVAGSVAG